MWIKDLETQNDYVRMVWNMEKKKGGGGEAAGRNANVNSKRGRRIFRKRGDFYDCLRLGDCLIGV